MKIRTLRALVLAMVSALLIPGQAQLVSAESSTKVVPINAAATPSPRPPAFPHVLFAPLYHVFGGYSAKVYAFNPTTGPVNFQLAFDPLTGATTPAPVSFTVDAKRSKILDLAGYLTPLDPDADRVLKGGLRLYHDGSDARSIRAGVVVEKDGMDKAFATPFTYPGAIDLGTQQAGIGTAYFGTDTFTYLALQNTTASPVSASIVVHLENGAGLNDNVTLPTVTVGGSDTQVIDVSSYLRATYANSGQATWGTIEVQYPTNALVARSLTVSPEDRWAFDSGLVDPSSGSSTTKVLSPAVFDYDSDAKTYVTIRNVSAASRTVTATFKTSSGTTTTQATLAAGRQTALTFPSRNYLSPGQKSFTDVRLSYSGASTDIVGGAVSLSPSLHIAIPARLVEASSQDQRRLSGPSVWLDGRTTSVIEVANLSASAIKVGARIHLATDGTTPIATSLVTVAANSSAAIDLYSYINQVPDDVDGYGAVELWHNGPSGAIAATCLTLGRGTNVARVTAFVPGHSFPTGEAIAFPNSVTNTPNAVSQLSFLVGSGVQAPVTQVAYGGGTVTAATADGANVYKATYTAPSTLPTTTATVLARKATDLTLHLEGTINFNNVLLELQDRIDTSDPSGVDTQGRINPDGATYSRQTSFTIRARSNKVFPAGNYVVKFKKGINTIPSETITIAASSNSLSGVVTAPSNYIGDIKAVFVDNADTLVRVSKDKSVGAYFSYDPPDGDTILPDRALNRAGGQMTINGNGLREFEGTSSPNDNILPFVQIGRTTGFRVETVVESAFGSGPSSTTGIMRHAELEEGVGCADALSPCRYITIRNPGGKSRDERKPAVKVFALLPGPAPVLTGVSPAIGPSDGGYKVTLNGANLFVVNSIGVGTQLGFIDENDARADNQITFTVPFGCAGSAKDIVAYSIDIAIDPMWKGTLPNSFTYSPIPVQIAPGDDNDNLENGTATTLNAIGESRSVTGRYAIGPPNCAELTFDDLVVSGDCAAASVSIEPNGIAYNQKGVYKVIVTVLPGTCVAGATYTGTIKFTLESSEPGASSRDITVPFSVTR